MMILKNSKIRKINTMTISTMIHNIQHLSLERKVMKLHIFLPTDINLPFKATRKKSKTFKMKLNFHLKIKILTQKWKQKLNSALRAKILFKASTTVLIQPTDKSKRSEADRAKIQEGLKSKLVQRKQQMMNLMRFLSFMAQKQYLSISDLVYGRNINNRY